mmetsp:Transcript_21249/g.36526  ORF Transcript_21249/g.36526 Transcript_21249/m.36526 type:complete len:92 (-) Transcript_21249:47-322(-)
MCSGGIWGCDDWVSSGNCDIDRSRRRRRRRRNNPSVDDNVDDGASSQLSPSIVDCSGNSVSVRAYSSFGGAHGVEMVSNKRTAAAKLGRQR